MIENKLINKSIRFLIKILLLIQFQNYGKKSEKAKQQDKVNTNKSIKKQENRLLESHRLHHRDLP